MRKLISFFILFFTFNASSSFVNTSSSFNSSSSYYRSSSGEDLKPIVGSRVNFDSKVGVVSEILTNGIVKIALDDSGEHVYKEIYDLGVGFPCLYGMCVGAKASLHSNTGTILEIFNNRNVKIRLDDQSEFIIVKLSELSRALTRQESRSMWHIVKDDEVVFGAFKGYVQNVFYNGNVEIYIRDQNGYYYTVSRYADELTVSKKYVPFSVLCKSIKLI